MPPSGRNTTVITRSSSSEVQRHISESELELLENLAFEEDELEMFFHRDYFAHISVQSLIQRYLEVAQHPPYNLNWSTKEEAIEGDYTIKRRIAEDTLESYYHPNNEAEGVGRSKKSHKKKRGTRKTRNKRQKRTRTHRTHRTRTRTHRNRRRRH